VLHTILNNPSLVSTTREHLFHSVLVIVPVNTLTNWEKEVNLWTGDLDLPLVAYNLQMIEKTSRGNFVGQWKRSGGLLIVGEMLFCSICKDNNMLELLQPDVLVLDEAHTMLKHSKNQVFKTLHKLRTRRRILLTGTPLQNNVTEYFRMAEFARPGAIGVKSEIAFEQAYRCVNSGIDLLSLVV